MIWAQARGGVIGEAGTMPWHIPEDLKYFKRVTDGHPVIMGRRTWESFPPTFRPLPGRTNIVITSDTSWAAPGAQVAHSLEAALSASRTAPGDEEIFIIGGGRVYAEAMPLADVLYLTEIDLDVAGDTRAPAIPDAFALVSTGGWRTSSRGPRFRWLRFER